MHERCLSFVAILGLLASQLAAMPHAHAGMTTAEQQKHAAKPHFHTGKHSHSHDHSHGGHSHRHDTPANEPASEPSHDDAAVYFDVETDLVLISKTASLDANQATFQIVAIVELEQISPDSLARHWHPPNTGQDGTETYLTLRNLRL